MYIFNWTFRSSITISHERKTQFYNNHSVPNYKAITETNELKLLQNSKAPFLGEMVTNISMMILDDEA